MKYTLIATALFLLLWPQSGAEDLVKVTGRSDPMTILLSEFQADRLSPERTRKLNTLRQARKNDAEERTYSLTVNCEPEKMNVQINFYQPFNGVIYSKGYYNRPGCTYFRGNNDVGSRNFSVKFDKCGTFTASAPSFQEAPLRPKKLQLDSFTTTPVSSIATTASKQTTLTTITTKNPVFTPQINPLPVFTPSQQLPIFNNFALPTYPSVNGFAANPNSPPLQNAYWNPAIMQGQQQLPQVVLQQPNYGMVGNPYMRLGRSMDEEDNGDLRWVENNIIIQMDAIFQDDTDEVKSIQCEWRERSNKKVVSTKLHMEGNDVIRNEFPQDDNGAAVISAQMYILSGLGPLSPESRGAIRTGSPLTVVVALSNSNNKFDLMVHSCTAKGGENVSPIQLVDQNGCVLREKEMSPFMTFYDRNSVYGDNRVAYAYFQAFKFPGSTELNVDCSVTVCRDSCTRQCFGKYMGDGKNYSKIFGGMTEDEKPAERIVRPENFGRMKGQEGIISALERELSKVNGNQNFELKVQSQSESPEAIPRLLPRQMDDVSGNVTILISSKLNSTRKFKREISSNVDVSGKVIVVQSDDVDFTNGWEKASPIPNIYPYEETSRPRVKDLQTQQAEYVTFYHTTPVSSTVPLKTPIDSKDTLWSGKIYSVSDEPKHICIPMMVLILGGVVTSLVICASFIGSVCVCVKVKRHGKDRHSFSFYTEPNVPMLRVPGRRLDQLA